MSVLQQNLETLLSVPRSASTPSAHTSAPVTTALRSAQTSARVCVSMFVVLICTKILKYQVPSQTVVTYCIYYPLSFTSVLLHTSLNTLGHIISDRTWGHGGFGSINFRLLHSGGSDQLLLCVQEAVAHCLSPF